MICQINDAIIYYEIVGSGRPIVMIHGFSPDHNLMVGCMEPLFGEKTDYKRIYIDLPGMGKSNAPDWINNSDQMLALVISFIDKIIPNENFLLAGESYGGYLARGIIYKLCERVDGLLLICPVVIADSNLRNVPTHTALVKDKKMLSRLSPDEAEEFCGSAVIQNEYTFNRCKTEILSGLKIANVSFLKKLKHNYSFSFNVDDTDKAKFLKPALFLTGRQDACVGYHDLWKIIENYPRATFASLDGAGHNLQIEQFELFNNLVNDWITRVEKTEM